MWGVWVAFTGDVRACSRMMYGCIYKCVEYMGEIKNWKAGRRKLMEGRWAWYDHGLGRIKW